MFAGFQDSSDDLTAIDQTVALFIDQAFHRFLPNPFLVVLAYSAIDSSIPVITRHCIHDQSFGRSPGVLTAEGPHAETPALSPSIFFKHTFHHLITFPTPLQFNLVMLIGVASEPHFSLEQ